MPDDILDARGVPIAPGDTAIYGFGVGRSVAMAEAVVVAAEPCDGDCDTPTRHQTVSLTPSGRVRLRVIRRSYADGEKPVVDVAPDRLVVLKSVPQPPGLSVQLSGTPWLPPSPLPTQSEVVREKIEKNMARYVENLRSEEVPEWWDEDLVGWHAWCTKRLAEERRKLKALDEQ